MHPLTNKIRDALAALDPSKDEDWTAQGLPAMASVCTLLGETVTRNQVEAAAPGFCRTDLVIPSDEPLDTDAMMPMSNTPGLADPPPTLDEIEAAVDTVQELDARAVAHLALEKRLAELDTLKAACLAKMTALKAEADDIERQKAEAQGDFNLQFPPLSEAEQYKLIVERNQRERARRVAEQNAAIRVLGQGGKSPLDRAMGARRGFGLQRPSYPRIG